MKTHTEPLKSNHTLNPNPQKKNHPAPFPKIPPELLAYLVVLALLAAGPAAAARRHPSRPASGRPVYIWPLPKNFTSGAQTLAVDPRSPGGGAAPVAEAFGRYRSLVFSPWTHAARSTASGGYDLAKLTVVVASEDETLELGVDESYTIYVAAVGGVKIRSSAEQP